MPRRPVSDGAHTVFTDHRITRRPPPARGTVMAEEAVTLVAWHEPEGALAQRNLGIADIKVGERKESFPLVSQGFGLLRDCWDKFPNDPALLTSIGDALLTAGQGAEAAGVFEQAIRLEPRVALHHLHAGLAREQTGDLPKAIDLFERALKLDPLMERSYRELEKIYRDHRDPAKVNEIYERFLKAFHKTDKPTTHSP